MTILQKTFRAAIAILAFSLSAGSALADTVIHYPTAEEPLFTIQVPDDWELTPAEAEDDFFLVTGPTEVEMWFRAEVVESKEDVDAFIDGAMESGGEWLDENYKEVEFGEVTEGERDGMPFVSIPGTGIYKETGDKVIFTIAFIFMKNGSAAEFWGILPVGDEKGTAVAQSILDSFEAK